MSLFRQCQVQFPCVICGKSITMRTIFVRNVHCNNKGCTASYRLRANGKHFQSLEWFHKFNSGMVPQNTLTITEDEVNTGEE
jgi:hypothetical protein